MHGETECSLSPGSAVWMSYNLGNALIDSSMVANDKGRVRRRLSLAKLDP